LHAYVLIPLVACITAVAVAGAAWARDPGRQANRIAALILVASGYWSLCEVVWNLAPDAAQAARITRLSSLGFLWFGPLAISLHAALDRPAVPRWVLRLLPWLYRATPFFIAVYVTTDWFVAGAEPKARSDNLIFLKQDLVELRRVFDRAGVERPELRQFLRRVILTPKLVR
jgi:hypothetical protein